MGKYSGYLIDDSTLKTFVENICKNVTISKSPGIRAGSDREMSIVLWEMDRLLREIRKDLDGPVLMKKSIMYIGELLYYCEKNEQDFPDICFFDKEEAQDSFCQLVQLYVMAHYSEVSCLIKRADDGWRYPDEAATLLKDGEEVMIEKLDGTVSPAKYEVKDGVAGFIIDGENWCVHKWTHRVPPNWTVDDNNDREQTPTNAI